MMIIAISAMSVKFVCYVRHFKRLLTRETSFGIFCLLLHTKPLLKRKQYFNMSSAENYPECKAIKG